MLRLPRLLPPFSAISSVLLLAASCAMNPSVPENLRAEMAPGGGYQRPRDPLSGVRHPIAHRPSGNSAAAAVEEPDEDQALTLVGASK